MSTALSGKISKLQGPILVLGGSGFVGANLFRSLLAVRQDVVATTSRSPAWRFDGLPAKNIKVVDLLVEHNLAQLLDATRPATVFNCIAYGAYSFETDANLIYRTNFNFITRLVEQLAARGVAAYVHAGSSSEYGLNASGPAESDPARPNSAYAVSKLAAAHLLHFWGKQKRLPCVNLRLYSIYGPYEDASRLMPNLVRCGLEGRYPPFVQPKISRDFLYVDDAVDAFVQSALRLTEPFYGESFNVGSGQKTEIGELAHVARRVFGIRDEAKFDMPQRDWDTEQWFARIDKIESALGWKPRTSLDEGLGRMRDWYAALPDKEAYHKASKKFALDTVRSVSAVIACYKDNQAIPIMYKRLTEMFQKLGIDYEIIFVNDCSPDDTEEVIRAITRDDRHVVGISHSRNFGSQAAFMSGMGVAQKNACVLLDGDLQDPPEIIPSFVEQWKAGYDVVYGRRVKREAPLYMQIAYRLFYRVFDKFSYMRIPHDAGDFSLLDRRVVLALLRFPERDLFLRGCRAFAGFKQTGVDYVRPERMFGVSTNNLLKNLGWAKKGILSFSNVPLSMLTAAGTVAMLGSFVIIFYQIVCKLLFPSMTAPGISTVVILILFFGSVSLFAIGLIGEYLAKVFEEVKQRPLYIRRAIIRDGEVRPTVDR